MSTPALPGRAIVGLRQAIRQCRLERQQVRTYAAEAVTAVETQPRYPSLESKYSLPPRGFRPSQATKQNRFEENLPKIRVHPAPRSTVKTCPNPIDVVYQDQLKVLDPTGVRTRLFSDDNVERVQPGDIVLVRLKNGDPFAGVCLNIRKRNSPIDTAILLRNNLTRLGVEMWFKIYSPNVEGIEIVQRRAKRARRAKLYYMRQPRHDIGSVENIVLQYQRQRLGGGAGAKGGKKPVAKKGGKK